MFSSKDKMARGQQRGCIRLRGAALGIDEENNALFTIAVDGKVFHLQVIISKSIFELIIIKSKM